MKIKPLILLVLLTIILPKYSTSQNSKDIEAWKLGWRMIENVWDKENEIASLQFDSLLKTKSKIKTEFLMVGLEVKIDLGKNEEVERILLNNKRDEVLSSICKEKNFQNIEICNGFKKEQVQNIKLQMEHYPLDC